MTLLIRHGATVQELRARGRWTSVKSARRYVATWEDRPWTDEHLPRPALVEGGIGRWQFIKGTARTARSLWPMSLATSRPGPSNAKDAPAGPTIVGAIASRSKRIPKKARVSRGATHVEVTAKIGHLAAMARRAAKSTTEG